MTIDQLLSSSSTLWSVVKVFYLLVIGLFALFSLIIIRQVNLMTSTIQGTNEFPIKTISYLFFALIAVVFIFALLIL